MDIEVPEGAQNWIAPDWSRPWFAPVALEGDLVRKACEDGVSLPLALSSRVASSGATELHRLSFVVQADLPHGMAYEQHIFDTGQVPTRDGLHDFFNGLCWLRFPATKTRLNQLQAGEIAKAGGVGQLRGPVRDALTLFDENAALLQAPEAIWLALLARDWSKLFVELRPLWAQSRIVLFGHALLEKLVDPYKSITAHVYRVPIPLELGDDLAQWDAWLARDLNPASLGTKPFTPLPVLGVPGWWESNDDPAFYADANVFRPPKEAT